MPRVTPLILLMLFIAVASFAETYKWIDKEGNVHYGDCPPPECKPEQIEIIPGPSEEEIQRSKERVKRLLKEPEKEVTVVSPEKSDEEKPLKAETPACFSPPVDILEESIADPYKPITTRHLNRGEYDTLAKMFGKMEGRWAGNLEDLVCLGAERAIRTRIEHYQVDLNVEWNADGLLKIESDLIEPDKRIHKKEIDWFLLKKDRLRFGDINTYMPDAPRWDVEIITIEKTSLVFMRKFRGAGIWQLELRSLQGPDGNSFALKEYFYAQGVLARIRKWTLRR